MKANFYPELTMRDDRRTVDASGPLNWEEIPALAGASAGHQPSTSSGSPTHGHGARPFGAVA